jgi:DNA (cytosine-5)-methyltransferase 1
MKIRVFESFAEYGSQALALKRLAHDYPSLELEFVGISEIEQSAIDAYHALHGDVKNYGDISRINWSEVPDFDLFTYSFPCQDISNAGLQKGFKEGSGTRSSLLWECRRAIEAKRPKWLLMENVKALMQKKFSPFLRAWIETLEGYGYKNFYRILNAKNFGIPQNRERVFMVSIRDDGDHPLFAFPRRIPLKKRLKDILEKDVDESFYLRQEQIERIIANNESDYLINEGDVRCINQYDGNGVQRHLQDRIFDAEGIMPAVTTSFLPNVLERNDQ